MVLYLFYVLTYFDVNRRCVSQICKFGRLHVNRRPTVVLGSGTGCEYVLGHRQPEITSRIHQPWPQVVVT